MNSKKAIPCIVLSFSPEEMEYLKKFLEEKEYSADNDGIKDFILDEVEDYFECPEAFEERKAHDNEMINQINDFIKNNPNTITFAANSAKRIFNAIKKRK